MKKFRSEADLQAFLYQRIGGQKEVRLAPGCRIDLRTNKYDIEIKPELNRKALDAAGGQLLRYKRYAGGRQQVIAGCTPRNYTAGIKTQIESFRAAGIEIWLIDQMPEFNDAISKKKIAADSKRPSVDEIADTREEKVAAADKITEILKRYGTIYDGPNPARPARSVKPGESPFGPTFAQRAAAAGIAVAVWFLAVMVFIEITGSDRQPTNPSPQPTQPEYRPSPN